MLPRRSVIAMLNRSSRSYITLFGIGSRMVSTASGKLIAAVSDQKKITSPTKHCSSNGYRRLKIIFLL